MGLPVCFSEQIRYNNEKMDELPFALLSRLILSLSQSFVSLDFSRKTSSEHSECTVWPFVLCTCLVFSIPIAMFTNFNDNLIQLFFTYESFQV